MDLCRVMKPCSGYRIPEMKPDDENSGTGSFEKRVERLRGYIKKYRP